MATTDIKDRLDNVTALLCAQVTALAKSNRGHWILPSVVSWFEVHKAADEKRISEEQRDRLQAIKAKQRQISELIREITVLGGKP